MKRIFILFTFLIFSFSLSAQQWLWGASGKKWSSTYSIASDDKGNAYLQGWGRTVYFGSHVILSPYITAWLVKFDSSGNFIWSWNAIPASARSDASGQFVTTDTS